MVGNSEFLNFYEFTNAARPYGRIFQWYGSYRVKWLLYYLKDTYYRGLKVLAKPFRRLLHHLVTSSELV